MKAEDIIKKYEQLKSRRSNWDSHWEETADLVMPNSNDVYGFKTPGEKKFERVFETTAVNANQLLASALHGMLTNPSVPWFELTTGIDEIDHDDDARMWLQEAVRRIHAVLNRSNFQTEIHEVYMSLGCFGTALMQIDEDEKDILIFKARPIYEAYVAENNKGLIDTIYRCSKWTVRQLTQEFGEDALPDDLKKDLYSLDEKEVIHAVCPRVEKGKDKNFPKNMPFASVYVLKEKKHILRESGFEEFPFVVPRWIKVAGEVYGRSPGMNALADIKMINEMMKTTLRGAQKAVDPPLWLPDDGLVLPIRATPSALNYYRAGMDPGAIKPFNSDSRIDFGIQMLELIRKKIQEAFFIDQLQLSEGPQMTATEVLQRTEEKLRLMGPILGRQQHELLSPMIDRIFGIMMRRNQFPQIPDVLRGRFIDVRYSSMIAKAQRTNEANNFTRVLQVIAPFGQIDPSMYDRFNADWIAKYVSNIFAIPAEAIRTDRETNEIRENRAEAQAQTQQAMSEQHQAELVKKVGPTAVQAAKEVA